MAKLAVASGLAHKPALDLPGGGQSLPVGDARHTDLGYHVEFATHPVYQDFEVKLTHTGDNGLGGLFVDRDYESRVLI